MVNDSHVHVGYYSRMGKYCPFYYSPRRIIGVLNRCGVENFIVSSTCAQVEGIGVHEIIREAREVKRITGERSHLFFWLSGHLYDEDPDLEWLETGLFEGIKLHLGETQWTIHRRDDLHTILSLAQNYGLPVMFHSGINKDCRPTELAKIASIFPEIHFNFAHCRPMDEMAGVMADCPNVWTDTAYLALDEFPRLCNYNWYGRLMFGTDIPVWQAHEQCSLTTRYRMCQKAFEVTGLAGDGAFSSFLGSTIGRGAFPDSVSKTKQGKER